MVGAASSGSTGNVHGEPGPGQSACIAAALLGDRMVQNRAVGSNIITKSALNRRAVNAGSPSAKSTGPALTRRPSPTAFPFRSCGQIAVAEPERSVRLVRAWVAPKDKTEIAYFGAGAARFSALNSGSERNVRARADVCRASTSGLDWRGLLRRLGPARLGGKGDRGREVLRLRRRGWRRRSRRGAGR